VRHFRRAHVRALDAPADRSTVTGRRKDERHAPAQIRVPHRRDDRGTAGPHLSPHISQ
jgi:hypothetical protein